MKKERYEELTKIAYEKKFIDILNETPLEDLEEIIEFIKTYREESHNESEWQNLFGYTLAGTNTNLEDLGIKEEDIDHVIEAGEYEFSLKLKNGKCVDYTYNEEDLVWELEEESIFK